MALSMNYLSLHAKWCFSVKTLPFKDSQMGYEYIFIYEYEWKIVLLAICSVVSIMMFDISEHRKWCFMSILL